MFDRSYWMGSFTSLSSALAACVKMKMVIMEAQDFGMNEYRDVTSANSRCKGLDKHEINIDGATL